MFIFKKKLTGKDKIYGRDMIFCLNFTVKICCFSSAVLAHEIFLGFLTKINKF